MVAPIPVTDPTNLAEAQARVKAAQHRQHERARQLEESMAARRAAAEAAEAERQARAQAAKEAELDAFKEAILAAYPAGATAKDPRRIIARVAAEFGVSVGEITGRAREARVLRARFAAIHAVKQAQPGLSLTRMGLHFGGRDHTTILNAYVRMERDGIPQPDGTNLKIGGGAA